MLWNRLNEFRLLLRTGRADAAVALAREAIPRIERMADRYLLERMTLLAADGLALTGQHGEAAALWAEATLAAENPSLDLLAEASRVAGRIAAGDRAAAREHLARADRILAHIGHVTARRDLARQAREILHAPGTPEPLQPPEHDRPDLDGAVPAHGHRLDANPPLANPRPSTASAIDTAAAAFDLAGHPALLGHELAALLHASAASRAAALVGRAASGAATPHTWTGGTAEDAVALADTPGAIVIPLGAERGSTWQLAVLPSATPSARATVAAIERLAASARALDEARRRERERAALWPEETPEQQLGFVVASESMTTLVRTMRRVAMGTVPVLITGETGTGKELLARALHETSPRRDKPYVPFNCTAVPRDMLDSQLFGYRRGAFTGAQDAFPGVIRAATGGTLLLDEIGELGLDVQPKLLRFLESGEVHPLGEPAPLTADVRVVAATNRSLEALVAEGRFREDLYYRLHVVRLEIPPLRERREEIPLLVEHFLEKWGAESQKAGLRIAEETMEYLVLYRWPGNVRELANELRRLTALAEPGAVLMPEHLSPAIAASRRTLPPSDRALEPTELIVRMDQPLDAAIEHLERAMVQQALRLHGRRVEEASRHLGLSRKGLYLKRQRLGID
ncbi:MAG: sigma-54 dependent transcriptional regulator [Vicinamibacterales bacterium]|nr:sigma-54 dependent transcriptional regulator [Vicinamibacterales bacterium]